MRLFTVHPLDAKGDRCHSSGVLRAATLYEAHWLARGRLLHAAAVEILESGRRVMLLDREVHVKRQARLARERERRSTMMV